MTTSAPFLIRDWNTQTDFPRIAAIRNGVLPDITTVEMLREEGAKQHPQSHIYRRVAVAPNDRVLGYAEVGRNSWDTPGAWELSLMADSEVKRQGIGSALYRVMRNYLHTQQATACTVRVRDHLPDALTFAQHRGFVLQQHSFASALTVTDFDEEGFAGVVAAAQASGIRFFAFADTDGSEAQ
jgi:GNAT superfamily N-acetyltransferase